MDFCLQDSPDPLPASGTGNISSWRAVTMRVRDQVLSVLATFLLCCTAVLFVANASPTWAQSTNTGTVAGLVTDASGAVVEGATVTLTDISKNVVRTATTNSAGRYTFVDVNPSVYSVAVSKEEFSTTKTENQEVKVGVALTVNLSLQVGGQNVVVEVSAVGNELQTMNATVGT